MVNLFFKTFPRSSDQRAALFQRADQLHNARDVIDFRSPGLLVGVLGNQCAAAVMGEEFFQQGTFAMESEQVAAGHTL